MKSFLISLFFVCLTKVVFSQGTIKGKVTSINSNDEVIGTTIILQGTGKGAKINFDGTYEIKNIPAGKYILICRHLTHSPESVKVIVKEGQVLVVDIKLKSKNQVIKEVVIEGKSKRSGENYIEKLKQKSLNVVEAISSEEISKRGDANAAAVAKRMTGVSVAAKGMVYVRGLGDRYSITTLNGVRIPGLDPNRNAVELNLFPSTMIDNMRIAKTFTPDLPGNFAGGLIDIITKDFADKLTVNFYTSLGINTEASLKNDFLTHKGGNFDFFGIDDGTRDIPNQATGNVPFLGQDDKRLEKITKSFNTNMDYTKKNSFINQKYAFSLGNKFNYKNGKSLSILGGLTYSFRQIHRATDSEINRYAISGNVSKVNELTPSRVLKNINSTERVLWGAYINTSMKLNAKNKISFLAIRNQKSDKSTGLSEGRLPEQEEGLFFENRALSYTQSSLTTFIAKGNHKLGDANTTKLDWTSAFALSKRSQPDLRYFSNDYYVDDTGKKIYDLRSSVYNDPTRFYRDLTQMSFDNQVNIIHTMFENLDKNLDVVSKLELKGGISGLYKTREKTENTFRYSSNGVRFQGAISDYINSNNFDFSKGQNIYIISDFQRQNNYDANMNILAAYAMGKYRFYKKNVLVFGLRTENTEMFTKSLDPNSRIGQISELDFLPSISIKREQTDKLIFRLAYSKTLARPSFREIAPFSNDDFLTGWKLVGNPNLKRTLIYNYDARAEFYPGSGKIISAGIFYKDFINPIETVSNTEAGNREITWRNLGKAKLYGFEIEFKYRYKQFTLGYNFSYIKSQIDVDSKELVAQRAVNPNVAATRSMFAQPPYIHNFFFEYLSKNKKFSSNLSYNLTGSKIAYVMIDGSPHVYDRPVHLVNMNAKYRLGEHHSITLKGNNILNPLVKQSQIYKDKEYIFNSLRRGANISLVYKYSL